jgi:hypothetical protein
MYPACGIRNAIPRFSAIPSLNGYAALTPRPSGAPNQGSIDREGYSMIIVIFPLK